MSHSDNMTSLPKYSVKHVSHFFTVQFSSVYVPSTALVNETKGLGLSNTGNSGIFGLSFPLPASIPATSGRTLLENIFASLDDYHRFFAYKLGRNQDPAQNQDTGPTASSFTIGQLDPDFANDTSGFQYTPVVSLGQTSYDYWKLPLRGITVNSNPLRLSP